MQDLPWRGCKEFWTQTAFWIKRNWYDVQASVVFRSQFSGKIAFVGLEGYQTRNLPLALISGCMGRLPLEQNFTQRG